MTKFKTANGRLTGYALACGYVERVESEDKSISIDLWREHDCYHVRAHNFNKGRIFWDSFDDNLTSARKRFDKAKRELIK